MKTMKCDMCTVWLDRDEVKRVGPENPGPDENYLDICPDCHIYAFQSVGAPMKEDKEHEEKKD